MDYTPTPTNPPRTRALSPTSTTETQSKRQKPFSSSSPTLFSSISNSTNPNTGPECWDWILTPGNTHYARDLTSFTNYIPLNPPIRISNTPPTSTTSCTAGDADNDELTVVGIGSVALPVQRSNSEIGTGSGILILDDVLHIPEALCNGFNPVVYGGWMRSEGGIVVGGRQGEGEGGGGGGGGEEWLARAFAGSFRVEMTDGRKGGSEVVDGGEYRFGVWVGEGEKRAILEAMGGGSGSGSGMVG